MLSLTKHLLNEPDFSRLIASIEGGGCPAVISGLSGVHRAHAAAAIRTETKMPLVVFCGDEREAQRLASDISALTTEAVCVLGERDFTFLNAEGVSRELEQRRIFTLYRMAQGTAPIVVMTIGGALIRSIPPENLKKASVTLKVGKEYELKGVIEKLVLAGYTRCEQVEGPGQFSVRGGILDFFSPAQDEPVRCEFFGDEIDSMSLFDISAQTRTEPIDEAVIVPSAETLFSMCKTAEALGSEALAQKLRALEKQLSEKKHAIPELLASLDGDAQRLEERRSFHAADRYMELIYGFSTACDYISDDAVLFLSEPGRIKERAEGIAAQLGEDAVSLIERGILEAGLVRFSNDFDEFLSKIEDYPVIMADSFTQSSYPLHPRSLFSITAKQLPSYGGSYETAAGDLAHYQNTGYKTVVLCKDERRAKLLEEYLRERQIHASVDFQLLALPKNGMGAISTGTLSAGMEYPGIKLAVITEGQIEGASETKKHKKAKKSNRERIQSFTDLSPGDLVVHEHHGIGRYVGIFKLQVDGVNKDYVKVAFAGTDSLYVPTTQLDLVSKYIGAGENTPIKLSKMGGAEWTKAKSRAKASAKDMAKELLALYAERRRRQGHAFAPDSIWQTEFEEKFGYVETEDQLSCIDEIKRDMEQSLPMDRLLCGDVGYGKTEVALRAVMKCILDGYQAAILVPTTVLAQQHFVTCVKRFAGYPVNIEVLSRFRTPQQIKKALSDLETGACDLVIGTHRILQKDVKYKKLGLLIVDEEQRFGVSHKEKLKELARQVDVLTLSATPIPRTLNMALSGIRDMSTIETPPSDRQPVQTYVLEHDWGVLTDAIGREVSRGGQVYYLHNRIENIERVAARIKAALGGITVAVAHGRMDEEALSDVMEAMATGDVHVLVCTTIIESGIDIPNVNTLIVEDADKLGLAQLHQIRGRVGRSSRRAYAYLTFRHGKVLTEIAEKRLSAVREFAEFNSGLKIAMRDLEIRGAGSLLGAEQSGHMISVGYDMYLKLLEEAVLEEKGEKKKARPECSADLSVSAYLPEKYVPSGEQRMDLYRRIAHVRTEEDSDEMIAELIDRYGDPPREALALISIAMLRGEASGAGISEIIQKDGYLRMRIVDFDLQQVSALYSMPEYKGRVRIEAGTVPMVSLKVKGTGVVDEAVRFIRQFRASKGVATG